MRRLRFFRVLLPAALVVFLAVLYISLRERPPVHNIPTGDITQTERSATGVRALQLVGEEQGVEVEAEVVETRRWRHQANDGTSHPHFSATLKIEGLREVALKRADGYERGQRVLVWVRRGPISGWPYFLDVAKPGEIERQRRQDEDEKGLE